MVSGTPGALAVFGAMVSLLNEARLQAKRPPMGFLNPFLYQNAHAFTDVVNGTNAIGSAVMAPGPPLLYGYAAAPGWDAATGLGTPRFDKLMAAAARAGPDSAGPPEGAGVW